MGSTALTLLLKKLGHIIEKNDWALIPVVLVCDWVTIIIHMQVVIEKKGMGADTRSTCVGLGHNNNTHVSCD
jgi:hypothetical protein